MAASKSKMVTAVFLDPVQGQAAYDGLVGRGCRPDEINVMMSDATRAAYFTADGRGPPPAATAAVEGMGVGGAIGTAVGATLAAALAVAGASVVIPGLIIAGPIAAAFAGGGAGAVAGGVIGGLVGLGFPEPSAEAYQDALRDGGVVLGVRPRSKESAAELMRYFAEMRGGSVCCV